MAAAIKANLTWGRFETYWQKASLVTGDVGKGQESRKKPNFKLLRGPGDATQARVCACGIRGLWRESQFFFVAVLRFEFRASTSEASALQLESHPNPPFLALFFI
jgi:hypothetical protein